MFIKTANLPYFLLQQLKSIGYHKADIDLIATDIFALKSIPYADYTRAIIVIVNLATKQAQKLYGSWGGGMPGVHGSPVDYDETFREISPNIVIIDAEEGGNYPIRARLLADPATLRPMLPESVQIDDIHRRILDVIAGYTSQGRKHEFERRNWGEYGPNNPYIQRLVQLGLVKVTGTGISITTKGKNTIVL